MIKAGLILSAAAFADYQIPVPPVTVIDDTAKVNQVSAIQSYVYGTSAQSTVNLSLDSGAVKFDYNAQAGVQLYTGTTGVLIPLDPTWLSHDVSGSDSIVFEVKSDFANEQLNVLIGSDLNQQFGQSDVALQSDLDQYGGFQATVKPKNGVYNGAICPTTSWQRVALSFADFVISPWYTGSASYDDPIASNTMWKGATPPGLNIGTSVKCLNLQPQWKWNPTGTAFSNGLGNFYVRNFVFKGATTGPVDTTTIPVDTTTPWTPPVAPKLPLPGDLTIQIPSHGNVLDSAKVRSETGIASYADGLGESTRTKLWLDGGAVRFEYAATSGPSIYGGATGILVPLEKNWGSWDISSADSIYFDVRSDRTGSEINLIIGSDLDSAFVNPNAALQSNLDQYGGFQAKTRPKNGLYNGVICPTTSWQRVGMSFADFVISPWYTGSVDYDDPVANSASWNGYWGPGLSIGSNVKNLNFQPLWKWNYNGTAFSNGTGNFYLRNIVIKRAGSFDGKAHGCDEHGRRNRCPHGKPFSLRKFFHPMHSRGK